MLFSAVYSCMIALLNPALILPMDSRLMPRTRARVDIAQTHRFPEFLQAPRQTACQDDFKEMQATVRGVFTQDRFTVGTRSSSGRVRWFCRRSGR
jgi:hypothetical protein